MADITQLLDAAAAGDPKAAADLLPLVYDELRKLAAARMAAEAPDHTLQPTALVHEAYLRLIRTDAGRPWNGRGHFFAAAAEAMRRILVDNARRKKSVRAGGHHRRVALSHVEPTLEGPRVDLLALDEALARLEAKDKRKAEVVKLRFFAGLTNAQVAQVLGISPATAENDWAYAKTWLRVTMGDDRGDGPVPGDSRENSRDD